jgi:gliding motility-associated-like protein
VIEKDNIQELFSKAFENHASPVRPDLWTGVQAKMAAAGMTGGAVAAKGISALAKWLIGTAAVTTVGVTAYVVTTSNEADKPAQTTITAVNGTNTPADKKIEPAQSEPGNAMSINPENKNNTAIERTAPVVINQPPLITDKYAPDVDDFSLLFSTPDASLNKKGTTTGTSDQGTPLIHPASPAGSKSTNDQPKGVSDNEIKNSAANSNEAVETKKIPAVRIELPNIFTPNGDRANDFCEFVAIENVKMVEITILDADGKTVYKSNDLNFKWDGTNLGGEQASIGIYTCLISYVDLGDVAKNKTAYIYLQR